MKPRDKELVCSICQLPIPPEGPGGQWRDGHNADPVNDGRCCGDCNATIVLPARIHLYQRGKLTQ